jgi:hypothetical protein
MRITGLALLIVSLAACGGATSSQGHDAGLHDVVDLGDDQYLYQTDVGPQRDAQVDATAQDDGPPATDGPGQSDSANGDDGGSTYRNSLGICWTDATCQRALSIGHGGAWDALTAPYLSNAAIIKAFDIDMDGVKIDVRVTSDNVPVLAHSSPITVYESTDLACYNRNIEDMTAAQVIACRRVPSSLGQHFQRLDDVLNYIRGKMVVQLCVKRSQDYQRTIDEIHTLGAEDFAFIELGSAAELQTIIPGLTNAGTVWYLVNVASNVADVDTLIDVINNPRAFMYEFDPGVDVSSLTPNRLHPAGIRSFTYDSATPISTATIQGYFENGYDVVSAQNGPNNVQARKNVNTARGISPP